MKTITLNETEYWEMQQTVHLLQTELNNIRNVFLQYVSTDDVDLRAVIKRFLTQNNEKNTPARCIPEITEGDKSISPTLLFGKWSNLKIDAKKLRQESWKEY